MSDPVRPRPGEPLQPLETLQRLSRALADAKTVEGIHEHALSALESGLGADRSAVLLLDQEGVMRFRAVRGLSERYQRAVEGHTPWAVDDPNPRPIFVPDVETEPSLEHLRDVVVGEGIRALAFVPLTFGGRLLGKFMVYFDAPREFAELDAMVADAVASDVAFALGRSDVEEQLRASREQLEVILGGVTDGITVQDPSGALLYANRAAAELIGFDSPEELLRTPVAEVMERFEILDESGRPLPLERLPGRRALMEGEPVDGVLLGYRILETGEERWSLASATPVLDAEGRVRFAINIFRDMTERLQAEKAMEFIARASELLSSSLDVEGTLTNLTGLLVPAMADWCIVDMLEPDGSIRQLAVAHHDPDRMDLVGELRRRFPPDWSKPHPITRVLATGRAEVATNITERTYPLTQPEDPENRAILAELGLRSHIVAPLVAKGRTLGALSLVMGDSGRRYSETDLPLIQEIARRAAVAVENAQLHAQVQETAWRIEEARARLDSVMTHAPIGLAFLDRELRYIHVNEQLARMNGASMQDHIGRTVREVLGDVADMLEPMLRRIMETGQPILEAELQAPAAADPGTLRHWLVSYYPVPGPDGVPAGIGAVVQETTDRRQAEELLQFQKSLLEAQTEASIEGILVTTFGREIVYVNERYRAVWGLPADVVAGTPHDRALEMAAPKAKDPQGHLDRIAHLYEHPDEVALDVIELADGRTFERYSRPIGSEASFYGRVWFYRDITAQKQAEEAQRFLSDATDAMNASLDYQSTFVDVATLAVPRLADACLVYMQAPDGEIRRVASHHPGAEALIGTLGEFRLNPDAEVGVPQVLRSGRPALVPDADASVLAGDVDDPDRLAELLSPYGFRSWMAVPLIVSGRVLGAIAFASASRRFERADLDLAEELARRASIAVQNAQLYRDARRSRDRLEFLAEASAVLSSSLEYENTLQAVARLAVPTLADWCGVDVLSESGVLEEVAVAHVDPEKVRLARELRARYPRDPEAPSGVPKVLRTGLPEIIPTITDELLQSLAVDEEHLRMMRELGVASAMTVPLNARGRTLGALTLVSSDSGDPFDDGDLAFAGDLARRAAMAIDNARLFRERSRIAETLQQSLLPPILPDIPGFEVAARYHPAAEGTDVGGDFYDLFQTGDNDWAIVIGDVCGKGVDAAALTGLTRYTIRATALQRDEPQHVLRALNDTVLAEELEGRFCTVAYGALHVRPDGAQLTVTCAGHPLPLVLRADGRIDPVGRPGTLLGVVSQPVLQDHTVALAPGDTIVLFTDGVTERRRGDELFGEEGLVAVLRTHAADSAERLAERIERAVVEFGDGGLKDDTAILLLKVRRPS